MMPEIVQDVREKLGHDEFRIVLDNAKFHCSKETLGKLQVLGFSKYLLRLPVQSPDINIIENLWGIAKTRVRLFMYRYGQIRKKVDIQCLLQNEWGDCDA